MGRPAAFYDMTLRRLRILRPSKGTCPRREGRLEHEREKIGPPYRLQDHPG
jgi:hypothetical protein